ncbi:MAG: hypothetical protein M3144_03400 [Actinomycetota bacterium]|nr:hypothetical protein [Actinomycetota bacterium]
MATVAGVVLAAGLVPAGTAHAAPPCTFYVSASGSDGNAGTSPDRPWATLERARDHIRQHGLNKDMRADLGVCLRGGRHTRTATFNLAEADSGSNGFKVVYRAFPGETPIIDGGKAVTGWKQVTDRPYLVADVPESAGYADYFRQLYVGDRRAQLAMGKGIVGNGFFDEASIPNPAGQPGAADPFLRRRAVPGGQRSGVHQRPRHSPAAHRDRLQDRLLPRRGHQRERRQ